MIRGTSAAKSHSWGCLQWCSGLSCSSQFVECLSACVVGDKVLGKAEGILLAKAESIGPNKEGASGLCHVWCRVVEG